MTTGIKAIFMEDLNDYIDSGTLFGPGNPNNWNRELPKITARIDPVPSSAVVTSVTFKAIAQIHAKWWKNESLLSEDYRWLRGAGWVCGQDEKAFEGSQKYVRDTWNKVKSELSWEWDPVVLEAVQSGIDAISWEAQKARLNKSSNYTLVHGDFWPGNVMWSSDVPHVKLIDWEMVGLGSGPQDLGQYVMSNTTPEDRRECEHRVVREYYDELVRLGVSNFTFEECWKEYTIGGVERWLWFLCYFAGAGPAMKEWGKFFHDQVSAFMRDHKLTAADLGQPRP